MGENDRAREKTADGGMYLRAIFCGVCEKADGGFGSKRNTIRHMTRLS